MFRFIRRALSPFSSNLPQFTILLSLAYPTLFVMNLFAWPKFISKHQTWEPWVCHVGSVMNLFGPLFAFWLSVWYMKNWLTMDRREFCLCCTALVLWCNMAPVSWLGFLYSIPPTVNSDMVGYMTDPTAQGTQHLVYVQGWVLVGYAISLWFLRKDIHPTMTPGFRRAAARAAMIRGVRDDNERIRLAISQEREREMARGGGV